MSMGELVGLVLCLGLRGGHQLVECFDDFVGARHNAAQTAEVPYRSVSLGCCVYVKYHLSGVDFYRKDTFDTLCQFSDFLFGEGP